MPYDARLSELAAAVAADPNSRGVRLEYAAALLDSGDSVTALEQVRFVLGAYPVDPQALGLGAMAAGLSGDLLAADAYSGALRKAQNDNEQREEHARDRVNVTIPLTLLTDIPGNYEEKRRLEQVVLRPYRLRRELPGAVPSGVLLFGPRNVGKASLAAALAGDLHLNLVTIDMATACDPWGLPSAGAITDAFTVAQENAPSLLFIDNLETVSHRRLRYVAGGRDRLAELEAAMDAHDRSRVLVVAATDAPWMLNPALRGRNRFDQFVLIGPPDLEARTAAIEQLVRARGLNVSADINQISAMAEGCTLSDLRSLVAAASMFALSESQDRGTITPVRDDHVRRALTEVDRNGTDWFDQAYNFPEFMDDSTAFDPLFDYIRRHVRR
jgi:SpoVK/Ycf46/Vps4 family AAA+-type ATPase